MCEAKNVAKLVFVFIRKQKPHCTTFAIYEKENRGILFTALICGAGLYIYVLQYVLGVLVIRLNAAVNLYKTLITICVVYSGFNWQNKLLQRVTSFINIKCDDIVYLHNIALPAERGTLCMAERLTKCQQ